MPELRQNIVTRDWVIIATERARRPDAFAVHRELTPVPVEHDASCPFCPGHETQTGDEQIRIDGPDGWMVRVISNKFPALVREGCTLVARHPSAANSAAEASRHGISPAPSTKACGVKSGVAALAGDAGGGTRMAPATAKAATRPIRDRAFRV